MIRKKTFTISGILTFCCLLITPNAQAVRPVNDLSHNTLIIYNKNTTDGLSIAEYYAQARGIDANRIVGVRLPPGNFASADQLMGARKTIIEEGICTAIQAEVSSDQWPTPCDVTNLEGIVAVSPITHLVITKGVPARLYGTDWPTDGSYPSFDYYLALSIYRNEDFFKNEENDNAKTGREYFYYAAGKNPISDYRTTGNSSEGYVRVIDPAIDRSIAYGRVEAITAQRTFDLIDRTLTTEAIGFQGNIVEAGVTEAEATGIGNSAFKYARELMGADDSECVDYLSEPLGLWPYESCRAGATEGGLPGESTTVTAPHGMNIGLYLGNHYAGNGQAGFDGFTTMTNWHFSEYDCTELCRQFSDPQEQQTCRDNSTDYFKEINTGCVGGAAGLMGWQYRSFPVQYYGFWPKGFNSTSSAGLRIPAQFMTGGAYQDETFQDNSYIRFGDPTAVEDPQCTSEDVSLTPCPELIGFNLSYDIRVNEALSEARTYTGRFRYRNKASSAGKKFYARFRVRYKNAENKYTYITGQTYSIKADISNNDWVSFEITDSFGPKAEIETMYDIQFQVYTSRSTAPERPVDFDGFEVVDVTNQTILSDVDIGSFNTDHETTHPGDYAANAIDRLGGIAWWGSSSHHLTGGHAFINPSQFTGAFFSGRSLGASHLYNSSTHYSGIIYGDPLYNPAGVKIFVGNGQERIGKSSNYFFIHNMESPVFKINAFSGQSDPANTRWELAICEGEDIQTCDANGWTVFETGNEPAYEQLVKTDITNLIQYESGQGEIPFILKLDVWREGKEDEKLSNYAYVSFYTDPFCGDGIISGAEECEPWNNFNGQTCDNYGLPYGALSCNSDCTINTDYCYGEVPPIISLYEEELFVDEDEDQYQEQAIYVADDNNNLVNDPKLTPIYDWITLEKSPESPYYNSDYFYSLHLHPDCADAGVYDIAVTAVDETNLSTTKTLKITVNETCNIPGDLDGDGDVDSDDLALLSEAYGSIEGDPRYNPAADLDSDGDVDGQDLYLFTTYFVPVIAEIPEQTVNEGELLSLDITASDPDNGTLHYPTENLNLPQGALLADNGDGTAVLSWTPTCSQSGDYSPVIEVRDQGNLSDSETLTISVLEDNIAPSVLTKDITIQLDVNGNASITPEDIDDGSTDACGVTLSIDKSQFTQADIGPNTVTLTVTDNNGNSSAEMATVTVEDNPPSSITVDQDGTCSLADAITSANTDAPSGGCPAGSGHDTIVLETDVFLDAPLPEITSQLTIEGQKHVIDGNGGNWSVLTVIDNGNLTLNETEVTGANYTPGYYGGGGGIYNVHGTVILNDSTVRGNTVSGNVGGGIFNVGGTVTLNKSTISGNSARSGGGIYNQIDPIVSIFSLDGEKDYLDGIVILNNSFVKDNSVSCLDSTTDALGGGIYNTGTLVLTNSAVNDNSVSCDIGYGSGGGIYNTGAGELTLTDSTVNGNSVSCSNSGHDSGSFASGGGIVNGGENATATLNNCTVHGNTVSHSDGGAFVFGGGIVNGQVGSGTLVLHASTVSDNSASCTAGGGYAAAGGIANFGDVGVTAIMTLNNSMVSGNATLPESTIYRSGGGIGNWGAGATAFLNNSTVTNNSSQKGGGIENLIGGAITLKSSIISGNTTPSDDINEIYNDSSSTVTANSSNLFGHSSETDADAFWNFTPGSNDGTATSDGTSPTPLSNILNPILADNGGPTMTHALVPGSPAIDLDAACSTGLTTDQRGEPRPLGAGCDAGAFEGSIRLGNNKAFLPVIYNLLLLD